MATRKPPNLARGRRLSIAQQWASIRSAVPSAARQEMNGNRLRCEFRLRPAALSCEYSVTMDYTLGKRPDVRVTSPDLRTRDGERAPHLFEDDSLCLFRFRYRDWSPKESIGRTILPWASLWLYFYEIWLVTGTWHGGGEHPDDGANDEACARSDVTVNRADTR